MLTPRFKLEQSDDFLDITIHAPFTNIAETEIFMENFDFRFFSKPYFLRLHLPAEIVENDQAEAKYLADDQSFLIKAPKMVKGQHFEGLDMITSLLTPSGLSDIARIESLSAPGEGDVQDIDEWYFDQQRPEEEEDNEISSRIVDNKGYGFGFGDIGVFAKLLEEFQEILDLKDPDSLTRLERRTKRVELENEHFSEDHVLADFFEKSEIEEFLKFEFENRKKVEEQKFTKEEQEMLISLPRKEYLVQKEDRNPVFFGLIDILFAFCYEHRICLGEELSSESGWTISKLSSTLSCCEKFETLKDCLVAAFRRSLVYPLHRNFELSRKVVNDVISILKSGPKLILKCLLEIIPVFNGTEGRYIFNQLYIEPYAVWVQRIKPRNFESLSKSLSDCLETIEKSDLGLDLEELERVGQLVLDDEEEEAISKNLQQVSLENKVKDSDDDSSSSDSDDDSSSSDSSSSTDSSSGSDSEKEEDQPS